MLSTSKISAPTLAGSTNSRGPSADRTHSTPTSHNFPASSGSATVGLSPLRQCACPEQDRRTLPYKASGKLTMMQHYTLDKCAEFFRIFDFLGTLLILRFISSEDLQRGRSITVLLVGSF
jgi:hypothetical protein